MRRCEGSGAGSKGALRARARLQLTTTMTSENRESYPGQSLSLSQLLYATKSKLRDIMLGGRYAYHLVIKRAIYLHANLLRTATALIQPEVRSKTSARHGHGDSRVLLRLARCSRTGHIGGAQPGSVH